MTNSVLQQKIDDILKSKGPQEEKRKAMRALELEYHNDQDYQTARYVYLQWRVYRFGF